MCACVSGRKGGEGGTEREDRGREKEKHMRVIIIGGAELVGF